MKKDNFANALIFPAYHSRHGQAFLDYSAAFVCEMDGSVVDTDAALQWLMPQFPKEPFDIGFCHWRGCFAVCGDTIVPTGQPAAGHLAASASVGGLSKSLWVHGDRTWQQSGGVWHYSDAELFNRMPLDLPHAIGHKSWQENPHGIGYYPHTEGAYGKPVANIEQVNQPMLSPDKPAALGTFSPLPSGAPSQSQWLGTFDDTWHKTRFPWLPDDTDQRWYDRVPQDQCLPRETYWRGDEQWSVTNMHSEHAELSGQLPGLRPRIFYRMKTSPDTISELHTNLDTVWLFPNDKRVVVIYRGQIPTQFEDAHDVERIGIFSETKDSPKLPKSNYEALWVSKIGSAAPVLLRPLAVSGMVLPKAVAAGVVAAGLAANTGVAAKPVINHEPSAKQKALKEAAKAAQEKAKKAIEALKTIDPKLAKQLDDEKPQINPEHEALKKAFHKGPEHLSKAMDAHFRKKFQSAIDEAHKHIKDNGLEDLLKDHKIPTVDEVMAKAKEPNPETANLKPEDIEAYIKNKLSAAEKEAEQKLEDHGLTHLVDEVNEKEPQPMSDAEITDMLSTLPIDKKDAAALMPAKAALEAKLAATKAALAARMGEDL